MKSVVKDILMLCKGRYDKEKHKSLEEALDAYYRERYMVTKESLPELTHKFIYSLWLKECIREFLVPEKKGEFYHYVLTEESLQENNFLAMNCMGEEPVTDFYDVMYYRVTRWLQLMKVRDEQNNWIIDLSDYEGQKYII